MKNMFSVSMTRVIKCATFLIAGLILYGSLMPSNSMSSVAGQDKIMHLCAYGLLALLAVPTFSNLAIWKHILFISLLGIGVELAQASMAMGREGSVWDACANMVGVVLGVSFWVILSRNILRQ